MSFRTVARRGYPILFNKNYYSYILNQNNNLWLRFRETSGTTPINSGNLSGLTIVWTPGTTGALGQTTQLGANEGYLFAAGVTDSVLTITNNAPLATLKDATTRRGFVRLKANSLGGDGGDNGVIFAWGSFGGATNLFKFAGAGNARLDMIIRTDGTLTRAITATTASLVGSEQIWAWDYDHTGTRKIRMWQLLNKTVTPLTLGTDTAGTGNLVAMTNNLCIGNDLDNNNTFDGVIDEYAEKIGVLWTTSELNDLAKLAT